MIRQTDVYNVAETALARLLRLQWHFGIKSIWLSMKAYGVLGIKAGKADCLYSHFMSKMTAKPPLYREITS